MTTFKPLHDYVSIKRDDPKTMFGSIILRTEEKLTTGTVIAVSDGHTKPNGKRTQPTVKVGDRVQFESRLNTSTVTLSTGETICLVKEGDIIGLLE